MLVPGHPTRRVGVVSRGLSQRDYQWRWEAVRIHLEQLWSEKRHDAYNQVVTTALAATSKLSEIHEDDIENVQGWHAEIAGPDCECEVCSS